MLIIKKILTTMVIVAFSVTATQAQLISTEKIKNEVSLSSELVKKLDNPEVQEKVTALGISPLEAKNRILAMSNAEILEIQNSQNQAGGAVVVVGLSTILLVVIILLLID